MVSVIVPVYNAEPYLGYCINSILKQTYKEIELILVNDGSKDNSLRICKNYEFLDKRVKVLDIPNGGVGNARNTGLKEASGEYVMFIDSDDVIHETMIETLYNSSQIYEKDLVKCGMKIVHLKDNKVLNTEEYTFNKIGNEVVYNKKNFLIHLMDIIWKTGLMEGPANGLYRLEVIKKHNILFPTTTQYGEDFLFNIEYFQHCNGAVLINKPLYYYIRANEESLSQKYIPDLFQNQKYLINKLKGLLDETGVWELSNQVAFANYFISHTFASIKMLFHPKANLSQKLIKKSLYNICNDDLVIEYIDKVDYIPEYSENIWGFIKKFDVMDLYNECRVYFLNPTIKKYTSYNELKNPGLLNRFICMILKKLNCVIKSRSIEKVINVLSEKGIKMTFKMIKIRYIL